MQIIILELENNDDAALVLLVLHLFMVEMTEKMSAR